VSQGRVDDFPEVRAYCERVGLALGARYAINVQCRLVDGKPMIFEINPRFSGTSSIRAMLGFNEPDLLIRRHVLGETIPDRPRYRHGTVLRGLKEILVAG
jgi:carbamoyl-phosphate synthase large subunit